MKMCKCWKQEVVYCFRKLCSKTCTDSTGDVIWMNINFAVSLANSLRATADVFRPSELLSVFHQEKAFNTYRK